MDIKSVPLTSLYPNNQGKIIQIEGGHRFKQRMKSLGIRDGCIIKVKSKQPFHGPITIEVCGSQMTIGRGMAQKIQVELLE
jgi:ferrous iron transport protein A